MKNGKSCELRMEKNLRTVRYYKQNYNLCHSLFAKEFLAILHTLHISICHLVLSFGGSSFLGFSFELLKILSLRSEIFTVDASKFRNGKISIKLCQCRPKFTQLIFQYNSISFFCADPHSLMLRSSLYLIMSTFRLLHHKRGWTWWAMYTRLSQQHCFKVNSSTGVLYIIWRIWVKCGWWKYFYILNT